jgi:hypothetical protein
LVDIFMEGRLAGHRCQYRVEKPFTARCAPEIGLSPYNAVKAV